MLGARSCPRTPDDGSAPPEGPEDRTTHARGDLRTAPLTLGGTRGPHHSPQRDPESTPRTQRPRRLCHPLLRGTQEPTPLILSKGQVTMSPTPWRDQET